MFEIRYVADTDKAFWFTLDKHLSESEFEFKVRDKRGYVISVNHKPMPTFWQGENLIHFAAFKKHLGIYPGDMSLSPFDELGYDEVFSLVMDTNIASMNVAIRNGMIVRGRYIKHYKGEDMPHYIFYVRK